MDSNNQNDSPFFKNIESFIGKFKDIPLASVFRFVSFIPHEKYNRHQHKRIEINYLKKGSCILRLDNESLNFKEGEMMIIAPDIPHAFEAGVNGCTLMQLEFLPEMFHINKHLLLSDTSCNLFSKNNQIIKIVNNIRIIRAIQRIITEMSSKHKYYKHLVVMYYAELLVLIYRHMDDSQHLFTSKRPLVDAVNYIKENFCKDIDIASIANHLEISERYLRMLFSNHMGLSPVNYINELRINKAIEMLRISELSIKEICYYCGFNSPQYFSRIFKKQMGVSPRKFIE